MPLFSRHVVGTACLVPPTENESSLKTSIPANKHPLKTSIPAEKEYKVNLVGHELRLNSVGFKAQDGVTAACATCAMWSALQISIEKFKHETFTTAEITSRGLDIQQRSTYFPGEKGLNGKDMERVIRTMSNVRSFLHTETEKLEEDEEDENLRVKLRYMLPFLDFGIPVLLIMESEGIGPSYKDDNEDDKNSSSEDISPSDEDAQKFIF